MIPIAAFLLNDTFPSPIPILGYLVAWTIIAAAVTGIVRRRVNKQRIPWPPTLAAVALFVAAFLIAIMADAAPLKRLFDPIATLTLMPGAPIVFALDPLIHGGAKPALALEHLALAAGATIYWYIALTGVAILSTEQERVAK